jgi:hypothetical protein
MIGFIPWIKKEIQSSLKRSRLLKFLSVCPKLLKNFDPMTHGKFLRGWLKITDDLSQFPFMILKNMISIHSWFLLTLLLSSCYSKVVRLEKRTPFDESELLEGFGDSDQPHIPDNAIVDGRTSFGNFAPTEADSTGGFRRRMAHLLETHGFNDLSQRTKREIFEALRLAVLGKRPDFFAHLLDGLIGKRQLEQKDYLALAVFAIRATRDSSFAISQELFKRVFFVEASLNLIPFQERRAFLLSVYQSFTHDQDFLVLASWLKQAVAHNLPFESLTLFEQYFNKPEVFYRVLDDQTKTSLRVMITDFVPQQIRKLGMQHDIQGLTSLKNSISFYIRDVLIYFDQAIYGALLDCWIGVLTKNPDIVSTRLSFLKLQHPKFITREKKSGFLELSHLLWKAFQTDNTQAFEALEQIMTRKQAWSVLINQFKVQSPLATPEQLASFIEELEIRARNPPSHRWGKMYTDFKAYVEVALVSRKATVVRPIAHLSTEGGSRSHRVHVPTIPRVHI